MSATVYDDRICALGEGPLWHPERGQLFWFDITGKRLLSRDETGPLEWPLPEFASAAGWIDADTLMIVTASGFHQFDIASGKLSLLAKLEAEDNHTRSNDGRTDPVGGFWVGTMGLAAEPGRGAIYRYFRGEVRKLFDGISIPNAICFSPDNSTAYFTDTAQGIVWKQYIDRAGWPSGRREALIDFGAVGLNPDGAVCDASGDIWIAQWGASRVACHGPDGRFKTEIRTGAIHTTCPAFGGADLSHLFATSATQGLDTPTVGAGQTWAAPTDVTGQREHRFIP